MAYFKQGAKTRITTDGSPVGLGAILEQQQEDGQYKPICCASRKLNNVEQRYSQFERETLAIKWACEKFFLYLSGINFEIQTDHKPLLRVLSPKSKPPSARIEKWLLYLHQFSYTLKHIAGKKNYADVLSRLPVRAEDNHSTTETEEFAHSIVSEAIPAAMTQRDIERESKGDETLQMIKEGITSADWTKLPNIYQAVKDELWVLRDLVMRSEWIVLPKNLHKRAIQLAHDGHQGIVRTKARLRQRVWWPDMDKSAEQFLKACHPCQPVGPRSKPEPVRSTVLPEGPWTDLAHRLT